MDGSMHASKSMGRLVYFAAVVPQSARPFADHLVTWSWNHVPASFRSPTVERGSALRGRDETNFTGHFGTGSEHIGPLIHARRGEARRGERLTRVMTLVSLTPRAIGWRRQAKCIDRRSIVCTVDSSLPVPCPSPSVTNPSVRRSPSVTRCPRDITCQVNY